MRRWRTAIHLHHDHLNHHVIAVARGDATMHLVIHLTSPVHDERQFAADLELVQAIIRSIRPAEDWNDIVRSSASVPNFLAITPLSAGIP
jgi:hypothetical protein